MQSGRLAVWEAGTCSLGGGYLLQSGRRVGGLWGDNFSLGRRPNTSPNTWDPSYERAGELSSTAFSINKFVNVEEERTSKERIQKTRNYMEDRRVEWCLLDPSSGNTRMSIVLGVLSFALVYHLCVVPVDNTPWFWRIIRRLSRKFMVRRRGACRARRGPCGRFLPHDVLQRWHAAVWKICLVPFLLLVWQKGRCENSVRGKLGGVGVGASRTGILLEEYLVNCADGAQSLEQQHRWT